MALQNDDVDFEAFTNMVASTERQQAQQTTAQKGFEVPDCAAIGDKAIVRFVNGIAETELDQGKPGSGRAKLFNIGWVRDDDGKLFLLTLPAIVGNKPMYKSTMVDFINKVLSRTWIENPNAADGQAKGSWKYFYEERDDYGQQQSGVMTLKQIFWNVFKSGATPGSDNYRLARSWRGQTVYVANVIDRLDYTWHQQNKKTKLLMKKVTVRDGRINRREVSFFAIGAPMQELTDNHGAKLNYDVLIVPGKNPTDKLMLKNVSRYKTKDFWDDVKSYITEEDKAKISTNTGFTDEESTWETIDIDKFYRFTSATAILKHFGKTIKAFDMMTGSNFEAQFKEEAAAEAKARGAKASDKAADATAKPAAPQTNAQPAAQTAMPTAAQDKQFDKEFDAQNTQQATPAPTPSFDTMQKVPQEAPAEMSVSAEAKADIDSFYDSLDD